MKRLFIAARVKAPMHPKNKLPGKQQTSQEPRQLRDPRGTSDSSSEDIVFSWGKIRCYLRVWHCHYSHSNDISHVYTCVLA